MSKTTQDHFASFTKSKRNSLYITAREPSVLRQMEQMKTEITEMIEHQRAEIASKDAKDLIKK